MTRCRRSPISRYGAGASASLARTAASPFFVNTPIGSETRRPLKRIGLSSPTSTAPNLLRKSLPGPTRREAPASDAMLYDLVRPALFRFDAEKVHEFALR